MDTNLFFIRCIGCHINILKIFWFQERVFFQENSYDLDVFCLSYEQAWAACLKHKDMLSVHYHCLVLRHCCICFFLVICSSYWKLKTCVTGERA